MNKSDLDIYYIKKTFELAKKGNYTTHPNPRVGALVVKNNTIIGKGNALAFEQFVLEEMELAACARRDLALRINNPMPGQVPLFAHSRECVTDLPGTSRITGEDRDLAIGRHLAVWNAGYSLVKSPAHRIVNSLVQLFHPGLPRNLRL